MLLLGKSHGQRSLVGCSPWGREESDITERLHVHFSLSCIGKGNGNPLQCSCLENPRHRGASWAAVYGVAQSWTRLKRLSSSSSRYIVPSEYTSVGLTWGFQVGWRLLDLLPSDPFPTLFGGGSLLPLGVMQSESPCLGMHC